MSLECPVPRSVEVTLNSTPESVGEGDSGAVGEGGNGAGNGASNVHDLRHFAPFAQRVQCHSPREFPLNLYNYKELRDAVSNDDTIVAYAVSI